MAALQNPVSFETTSMRAIPEELPRGGGTDSEIDRAAAAGRARGEPCCRSAHPCQTPTTGEGNANHCWDKHDLHNPQKNRGKPLSPSPSTVSESSRRCPATQRQSKRSNSDICPELIPRLHVMQCKKTIAFGLVSPKLERRRSSKKDFSVPSKVETLTPSPPVNGQEKELQTALAEKLLDPQNHPLPPCPAAHCLCLPSNPAAVFSTWDPCVCQVKYLHG
ncbi:hypothetical protein AAFF_G00393300 [Aldrovandia affinis]|uniref:Uncharacterized protein n=1 Tax=Aldrovandia affinis TaxID=143900 RepID=A0AAD7SDF8_9TELE|nr:hypothetical protein AAFF_G00393300 [Aldrovandia affinis]